MTTTSLATLLSLALLADPLPLPEGAPARPVGVEAPDGTVPAPCAEAPVGMACVPGGWFLRGSNDGPPETRSMAWVWVDTVYMDIYEVTTAEYQACVKSRKCDKAGPKYKDYDRPKQPITGVSWFDSVKYCKVHGQHLPTEAEWEHAARGNDGRAYPWGNEKATCKRAVIKDKSGRSCGVKKAKGSYPEKGRTWEVGKFPPTLYGLYDMCGNSWEWVYDWHSKSYEKCGEACLGKNPRGPCDGADSCRRHYKKIVKGGSWYWDATWATTYFRRPHVPSNNPYHHFGFRCAASVEEAAELIRQSGAEK